MVALKLSVAKLTITIPSLSGFVLVLFRSRLVTFEFTLSFAHCHIPAQTEHD